MKKSLLVKSSGLYCINFELIDRVTMQEGMTANRVLFFNDKFKDPLFILYYNTVESMERAYWNIVGIIESKTPGKVIRVDFRKE